MTSRSDPSTPRLVVGVRIAGLVSETFVRRHVEDLDPRGAVVISQQGLARSPAWSPRSRHLDLSDLGFPADPRRQARTSLAFSRPELLLRRRGRETVARFLSDEGVTAAIIEYLDVSVALEPLFRGLDRRIFHAHGYDQSASLRRSIWRRAYRRLSRADTIVVVSEHARRRLVEAGVREESLRVVPYGVPGPASARADGGESDVRLLAVGRMVRKKAPLDLIRAVEQATHGTSNVRVDVVGDGPLYADVVAYVRERGLTNVRLHGALGSSHVARLMHEAHVFVQHSVTDPVTGDEEGLPVAILEAMAHGVPIVATRHAGIPEAVDDGVEGILVAEGDTGGMARAIRAIVDDSAGRHRMGAAARRRWERDFRWETNRERLLALLSDR